MIVIPNIRNDCQGRFNQFYVLSLFTLLFIIDRKSGNIKCVYLLFITGKIKGYKICANKVIKYLSIPNL